MLQHSQILAIGINNNNINKDTYLELPTELNEIHPPWDPLSLCSTYTNLYANVIS